MLSTLAIPLWCAHTIPQGVSPSEFYDGFYPTEEWVALLKPIAREQRQSPFQSVQVVDSLPDAPKLRWPGPTILITRDDVEAMEKRVRGLLSLPPESFAELVPRRNRIAGNARVMPSGKRVPCPKGDEGHLTWQPVEPDTIRCTAGHIVEPFEAFPPTGTFQVTDPLGETQDYPYHDTEDGTKRIYLAGEYMTPLRVAALVRAAVDLATLYALTRTEGYAQRAAAILFDFSRAVPHWPKVARGVHSRLKGRDRFRPIGDYRVYAGIWYDKYHSGTGGFPCDLARAYDLTVAAPVWQPFDRQAEGGDARACIEEQLFLYTARDAIRYDIRHQEPASALSNYIPYQITGFLAIGRAIGLPELVHYAYWKEQQLARKTLMADSMFPESPSYARQHVYGMARAARLAEGYTDPPGFTSGIDGRRFEGVDMLRDLPELRRAIDVLETLTYPDGENMIVHDTYGSLRSRGFPAPERTRPLLYPAFGHAVLARGERGKANQIQAHLHYSGNWGHDHLDVLNLIFWAHEGELLSDVGYAHTYRMFADRSSGHNLVVVDRLYQGTGLDSPGDLVGWYPSEHDAQVVEVSAPDAYAQCSTYRRALFLLPVDEASTLVLDVFDVAGGAVHEWMAQGSCMVEGTLDVSCPTTFLADSYADDGSPFTPPPSSEYMRQRRSKGLNPWRLEPGEKDPWYGVFRDVYVGRTEGHFEARFTYDYPEHTELRLHMLAPGDARLYTCTVPSLRRTWSDAEQREVHERVEKFRMPKLIVRRDGVDLTSRFVALWEPVRGRNVVVAFRDLAPDDPSVVAVEIRTGAGAGNRVIRVIYCPTPDKRVCLPGGIEMQGRYAVLSESPGETRIALYDVDSFVSPQCTVTLAPSAGLPLVAVHENGPDEFAVVLDGSWPDCTMSAAATDAEQEHVILSQDGTHCRAFPVNGMHVAADRTVLHCSRHPGFSYDRNARTLKEAFFPFNTTEGEARVRRRRRVLLRTDREHPTVWRIRTTDACDLNSTAVAPTVMGTEATVAKPK